jgi:hypothetical protein
MITVVSLAALGLAGYYLTPEYSSNDEQLDTKNEQEIREAMHTGFLRGQNTTKFNILASEETRVIRNPNYALNETRENAAKAWKYYKERNDMIAKSTNGAAILINRGTIRPNNQKKPGLLGLPTKEGKWGQQFGDIANAYFDIDSGIPADQMTRNWRDQYGDAGGFPRDGKPNVVLNELYVGNPWGAGGQLFEAVGNQARNPGYADVPPTGYTKPDPVPAAVRLKNRVKFAQ